MLCQDLPRSAAKDAAETGRWKVDELIDVCHESFVTSMVSDFSDIFNSYSNQSGTTDRNLESHKGRISALQAATYYTAFHAYSSSSYCRLISKQSL